MLGDFVAWFGQAAREASPHKFAMILAIAAIGAATFTFHAFRSLRWWRMVEDVPTSRARSAHQGYVELIGTAQLMDGPPILTPITRRECVWWSLHSERRSGDDWRTVSREVSDELFFLRDETGDCIVDPEGARVTSVHRRVTRGGSATPQLAFTSGGEIRHTEQFVVQGDQLYVIGFFRTFNSADHWDHEAELIERLREWKRDQHDLLRRFDADKDGRIDEEEWRAARRAARQEIAAEHREATVMPGVNVIGAPDDGRPFLIAAEHETQYTRRLRRTGIASALAALVAWSVAIGMLGARF